MGRVGCYYILFRIIMIVIIIIVVLIQMLSVATGFHTAGTRGIVRLSRQHLHRFFFQAFLFVFVIWALSGDLASSKDISICCASLGVATACRQAAAVPAALKASEETRETGDARASLALGDEVHRHAGEDETERGERLEGCGKDGHEEQEEGDGAKDDRGREPCAVRPFEVGFRHAQDEL